MNTICCNNCKISINCNNGISIQSHYLSVSFSFPGNVHALALKCQNIPQKLQVRIAFHRTKNDFWKNCSFAVKNGLYDYRCPFLMYIHSIYLYLICIATCFAIFQCVFNVHSMNIQCLFNMYSICIQCEFCQVCRFCDLYFSFASEIWLTQSMDVGPK